MTKTRTPVIPKTPQGATLLEPLVKWGNRDAAQEMSELKAGDYVGPLLMGTTKPYSNYETKVLRYAELREQLEEQMSARSQHQRFVRRRS